MILLLLFITFALKAQIKFRQGEQVRNKVRSSLSGRYNYYNYLPDKILRI